ncbi:hypothetical protein ACK8HY_05205 [Sphingobacterium sp. NGMCC 1.201703]|uniref:hypothetical protein n=1 Tax=Sphingobacterium sp. NGMCC 1.201703 TaxID=3388657 RepID=UPI0039FD60F8
MFTFDLKIAQNILKGAACVDLEQYKNKDILPDVFNVPAAPFEKTLVQLMGNHYRHTNGTLPALHRELV